MRWPIDLRPVRVVNQRKRLPVCNRMVNGNVHGIVNLTTALLRVQYRIDYISFSTEIITKRML